MRIIPKNTKIKIQFYKGITITDVLLALVGLTFLSLAVTSNLPNKYTIAIVILMVVSPLYIPVGDGRLYNALLYTIKFIFAKKKYKRSRNKKNNISVLVPYQELKDNFIV